MSMLPSWLLSHIRGAGADFLSATCRIEVQDYLIDDLKSEVKQWTVVAESVPCRVIQATSRSSSSEAALVGKQESLRELYRIALPPKDESTYTWDLTVNQRITLGSAPDQHVYHVVAVEQELTNDVFRHALITRELAGQG